MQIDFRNDGQQPYTDPGYFIALGSTRPIHPKDMPTYTRLVWCINGEAKGVDVSWFEGSGGFLGFGQHAPRPFYQEKVAGADWAAMSNQFFTTILTPLNAKIGEVWGKRVEVKRGDAQERGRNGRRDGTSRLRTSTGTDEHSARPALHWSKTLPPPGRAPARRGRNHEFRPSACWKWSARRCSIS